MFLNTNGDVLSAPELAAFQGYIEAGGGYAGVHNASGTLTSSAWYGQLVGAQFSDHPNIQQATVHVLTSSDPSTTYLPANWVRTDEWYNFLSNPKTNNVTVLANLDESTYTGGKMGTDHPIMWEHAFDGGRAWYTAMGHTIASYSEPLFRYSLLGGIRYAMGG